jgi:catechol 2,3-dioxygenase-like lactoylglutathione lyase family enzyme
MICKYVALFVPDLRAAEAFYRELFGMKLLFREGQLDETWATLPLDKGWEDAERAGVELSLAALERGGFVLALFQGAPRPGTVLEICFGLDREEIDELLARLPEDVVLVEEDGYTKLADSFGYRWALEEPDDAFVSYGERVGQWLDV